MPELPEVETTARGLAVRLLGTRITAVLQQRKDLRTPLPKNLAARLRDRTIKTITRRAKYILVTLDDGQIILLHLGMSGRLVLAKSSTAAPGKHDHVVLRFANGQTMRFNDPRRFGMLDLVAGPDQLARHKNLGHLGIEPLSNQLTAPRLATLLARKNTSIKAALLDQRLIAGLGNIYVCEALYGAGINPKRRTGSLRYDEIGKLVPAIRQVLRAAIKAGGSSLRDYVQADGKAGFFQDNFAVYDRADRTCPRCRRARQPCVVKRITQAGRSTFFCPTQQR